MNIQENVSLASYSTMGLGGQAAHLTIVESRMELLEAISWAQQKQLSFMVIGSGSNIVWRDEGYTGIVIVNKIERYETFHEDDENVYITAGSGENWDTVVERTAQAGFERHRSPQSSTGYCRCYTSPKCWCLWPGSL